MKQYIFTLTLLVMFGQLGQANENAVQAAKLHVKSVFKSDYDQLTQTYASTVQLMPGHEFLKKEYELKESRSKGAAVER